MKQVGIDMSFVLRRPMAQTTSVVFASPHSGRNYPAAFLNSTLLDALEIRSSEDAFVDDLCAHAVEHGAPLLMAQAPRAYLDLNRNFDELDPALIRGVRKRGHNPRLASGLGVIPRVVANGRPIYRGKMSLQAAQARIEQIWEPYHAALSHLMREAQSAFGEAILLDCHSMPHEALDNVVPPGAARPDIVLGDRFGASASASITGLVEAAFVDAGFKVARNMPFAGAYICQAYGRPSRRNHAIQIEINRALYMDEDQVKPNENYKDFKDRFNAVIRDLAAIGRSNEVVLAAE